MKYTVRKSIVRVVGRIWMPAVIASNVITMSAYDIDNARDEDGKITRESVEDWLGSHAGDFQSIIDFEASIEDGDLTIDIPFASEDGEMAYIDTLGDEE